MLADQLNKGMALEPTKHLKASRCGRRALIHGMLRKYFRFWNRTFSDLRPLQGKRAAIRCGGRADEGPEAMVKTTKTNRTVQGRTR